MTGNQRWKWMLLLVLAVVAGLTRAWWWPSEEQRILKMLARLAQEASVPAQGKPLADLAAANRVADFFASPFQVNLSLAGAPDLAWSERSELVQAVLTARSRRTGVQVELLDPQVVARQRTHAVVEVTARAQVGGEPDPFIAELRFTLVKLEGRWRVRQIENVPTFQ